MSHFCVAFQLPGSLHIERATKQHAHKCETEHSRSYRHWNSLPLDIRSAPTLSTFKNMLKTHLFSRSYFTDQLFCRVRAANIVRRPCSDSSHVTAPYNCRFIIIIIIIIIII